MSSENTTDTPSPEAPDVPVSEPATETRSEDAEPAAQPEGVPEPAEPDVPESDEGSSDNEVDQLRKELAEVTDARLRVAAELDNFRRRTFKQQAVLRQTATEALVLRLLDVADALDGALASSDGEGDDDGLRKGLELIATKLEGVLGGEGVVRIVTAIGSEFDPSIHEALASLPSPDIPEGQIANVVQAGYRMGEKIVRPARVIVSSGGAGEPEEEGNGS